MKSAIYCSDSVVKGMTHTLNETLYPVYLVDGSGRKHKMIFTNLDIIHAEERAIRNNLIFRERKPWWKLW